MSEQDYRRKLARGFPPIELAGAQLDASMADEQDRERKDWYMKRLMHSDGPIEKDLVRGAALGLFSYVQYEEMERSSHYSHKKGWFGHTSDEESNSIRSKRWAVER
jgi:hypothetical protein